MATAGSIVVSLLAQTGSFETDMDRAARKVDQTARTLDRYVRAMGAASLAAATAAGAITVQTARAMDATAKMAAQIGISTEALTSLRFAVQQFANVSDQQFDQSLRRMTRRIAEAAQGGGAAKKALEDLGLSAQRLARMSPEKQFLALADAMAKAEHQGSLLTYQMAIFDTEGMVNLPAMQQGREALEAYMEQARLFGVVLSGEAAKAAEDFTTNLGLLNTAQRGLRQQMTEELLPTMLSITDTLVELAENVGDSGETIASALRIAAAAGVATAGIFASRLLGSVYASAAGWVVATKEAAVHQAQLARLAAQAAGTSSAMTAMGAAAAGSLATIRRAASLALGVMGGPAGLIITAGLVGASFLAMGRDARAAAGDFDEFAKSLAGMTESQLLRAQSNLLDQMPDLIERMAEADRQVQFIENTMRSLEGQLGVTAEEFANLRKEHVLALAEVDDLSQQYATLTRMLDEAAKYIARLRSGAPAPTSDGDPPPPKRSGSSTDPLASFRARLAETQALTAALEQYGLAVDNMLPAERELLKLQAQMGLAVKDRVGRASDATLRAQIALTQEIAAQEKLEKQLRMTLEMRRDYTDAIEDQNAALYTTITQLEDQVRTWALTDADTARNVDALAQARTRERIAAEEAILSRQRLNGASEEEIAVTEKAIAALRRQLEYREREAELNEKIRQQQEDRAAFERTVAQWTDTVREIDDVFRRGFADMINAGEGSWKAFTKSMATTFKTTVADTLYKAFAQPFVVRIVAQMAGIMGGPGVGQQVMQQAGLGGGMPSMGWLTNFGGSVTDTLTDFAWRNIGSEGFMGDISRALFDHSEAIGQFAEIGGDILGYGRAIYSAIQGNWGTAAGAAIGTYFGGPIGSFIGSTIGGFIDDAFKGETRFGAGYGIGHENIAIRSGGPSGGDPNEAGTRQAIEQTWQAIHTLTDRLGGSLAGWTMGAGWELSPEKGNSFVWTDLVGPGEFVSYTDGIGRRDLPGVKDGNVVAQEFAVELQRTIIRALQMADVDEHWREWIGQFDVSELDEAGVQNVIAMIDALTQLQQVALDLGMTNLANATAQAQANIITFAGGIDAFSSSLQTYQENFYTEAERQEFAINALTRALDNLGMEMPPLEGSLDDMRMAWRLMVNAQDLTTESGQRTYAALINLAGAFDQVASSAAALAAAQQQAIQAEYDAIAQAEYDAALAAWEAANRAYQNAVDGANVAMQIVRNAIDRQKEELRTAYEAQSSIIQTTIDAAQGAITRLQALAGRLGDTLDSMFASLDPMGTQQQAMREIASAAQLARLTGVLPDLDSLETALQRVASPSTDMYATLVDFQRDFYSTASDIGLLHEMAGDQLTIEQRALTTAQDQLAALTAQYEADIQYYDAMLSAQQALYDAAMGNTVAVMSVADAVANLRSALSTLGRTPDPGPRPTPPAAVVETPEDIVAGWYSDILGFEHAEGQAYWVEKVKNEGRDAVFDDFIWSAQQHGNIPSFDVGTNYVPFDMPANIHAGERIIPAAENRELMARLAQPVADSRATQLAMDRMAAEMEEMRRENRQLLIQVVKYGRQVARHTELWEEWNQTGGVPVVEQGEPA